MKEIFNGSLQTGFVDKAILSNIAYQPELLVNQKNPPKKVLSTLLHELDNCEEFFISVAFVTTSGVATIINKLLDLEKRGIKGKILVSQYLNFTQPEALKRLIQFKNIEVRIAVKGNAHSKGYIFKSDNHYNLIVGSSNLTAQALSTNKEWNIKVSALDNSGIVEKLLREFHSDFENGTAVDTNFITSYSEFYRSQFLLNQKFTRESLIEDHVSIIPNEMQIDALKNLAELRNQNKTKALIISATGTGKTFLSAFDAKAFQPKKLLFVVHRLTIAKESLRTFRKVFGQNITMGLFSGDKRELDCDFIFSTIQTISKSTHLKYFNQNHFDYIIIDETHRSGAETYLRLINYFKPKFLLGMTATPERTDGNDIFKLFDHNIAYEIRLNKAMEEEMLSTFHYYGVTDLAVDGKEITNKSDFNLLVSNERANKIIEQSDFYGSDNGINRGLIFCSRKNEAVELSSLFNRKGFKTVALTGDSSEQERSIAIEQLESDSLKNKLDYIFTVDIFNEGIDIPKINQIIMLRPTESAIIFIQQLGRGLRKVDGKSYLTVIDFIGNYENNYLIPIALYGDTSYNKDSLRKLIKEGSTMLPGASTINFDEITKEKIFKSIDTANMQMLTDLKKDYNLLKFKLGRIPMMTDFIKHGSRDPYLYVNYSNSYYNFISKVEEDFLSDLSKDEIKLLELFSKEINNSKRVEESVILELLIENGSASINDFKDYIYNKYKYLVSDETIYSCISNLNFEFIREKKDGKLLSARKIYNLNIIEVIKDRFVFSHQFHKNLSNENFKKFLTDSLRYSIFVFDKHFEQAKWKNGFVLYRKYSRKDVFRILNCSENPVAQNVGGYLVSPDNSYCPIFVNYHKDEDISESTKYDDRLVNTNEFDWMSKSNRKIDSKDVQSILGKCGDIRLPLFIKKNNDEGMDFYYMGEVSPNLKKTEQTTMKNDSGKPVSVVKIRFNMQSPVSFSMYNYLEDELVHKSKLKDDNGIISSVQQVINFDTKSENTIPLYSFYAAAGTFSDIQSEKDFTVIKGPPNTKENYFACKIIGESMNRVIPNGSICMFKPDSGGSRNGKIVLVENMDIQDPDFKSAFTIKTYSSEKVITDEGWEHKSIVLRPNSFDKSFKNLIITEDSGSQMRVVGEFVSIISSD